ncbi:MAG: ankyrin repeat domain-containing protein [Gemmatimonadales bacterium]|nr:ankyrin repeat domain-containing protein [Gemmatimonadales bacterium]
MGNRQSRLIESIGKGNVSIFTKVFEGYFFQRSLDPNITTEAGSSLMSLVAGVGALDIARYLIARGANPNGSASDDMSPLHISVVNNDRPMMLYLIDSGASMGQRGRDRRSLILRSIEQGDRETVRLLIESGAYAEVDSTEEAIMLAILQFKRHDLFDLFLLKFDPNRPNRNGVTPLMTAALMGDVEMMELLSDKGAKPDLVDDRGRNVSHYAAITVHSRTIKYLQNSSQVAGRNLFFENGIDVGGIVDGDIWSTVSISNESETNDSSNAIACALKLCGSSDMCDANGNTPLYYAASSGDKMAVSFLMEHGCGLLAENRKDMTTADVLRPLLTSAVFRESIKRRIGVASDEENAMLFELLVTSDNKHVFDEWGVYTQMLSRGGERDISELPLNAQRIVFHFTGTHSDRGFKMLQIAEVDLLKNEMDENGAEILRRAIETGNLEYMESVCRKIAATKLTADARKNVYDVLNVNAYRGFCTELLRIASADGLIRVREEYGEGIFLYHAAFSGGADDVRRLLEAGWSANVNIGIKKYDIHRMTPLHQVAMDEKVDVAKLLIEYGADVNAETSMGITPIMYACRHPDYRWVSRRGPFSSEDRAMAVLLLEHGANINHVANDGDYALRQQLQESGVVENARFMLDCGARVNLGNAEYESASSYSVRPDSSNHGVGRFLRQNAEVYTEKHSVHEVSIPWMGSGECGQVVISWIGREYEQALWGGYVRGNVEDDVFRITIKYRYNTEYSRELFTRGVGNRLQWIVGEVAKRESSEVNAEDEQVQVYSNMLAKICKLEGFLVEEGAKDERFDVKGRNIRARIVGEEIEAAGGIELMRRVYYVVEKMIQRNEAAHLQHAWESIGSLNRPGFSGDLVT